MTSPIPQCDSVCEMVMQLCAHSVDDIDGVRLHRAVADAMWARLHELTHARTDVEWVGLVDLRAVPDSDHRHLAAYLSTRGAVGLALIDKLRSYLLYVLPQQLVVAAEQGMFDGCDLHTGREP